MRRRGAVAGLVLGVLTAAGLRAAAESKNMADYPLRLHIFNRTETNFYHYRENDESKGEGRADLYENSVAHGVDFSFDCGQKVKTSFGYETYPAKWKKPGKELVVLLPVFGEAGKFFTCNFKTDMKDFAYARGKNGLQQETVEQFKAWMTRVDYDPERGKDVPVKAAGASPSAASPASAVAPSPAAVPPPP